MKTVAIIGAGPAGCAAALALSAVGVRCAIFESGREGKDKACGDAFVPEAVRELRQLGVNECALAKLGGRPFQAVSLNAATGEPLRVPIGGQEGWVVRRAAIDQHLRSVAAMNSEICYGTAATALEPHLGSNRLQLRNRSSELFAGVVIATGGASNLARDLGIDGRPEVAVALSAYMPGGIQEKDLECYFGPRLRPGYGWRFPVTQDCANIGICLFSSSPGTRLRSLAAEFAKSLGGFVASWRGGLVPLWNGTGASWHRFEGIVSCGDAAGLVDSSTGEGLSAALRSGWEAGQAVGAFIHSGGDVRTLERYSLWVQVYFSKRYARSTPRDFWDAWCGLNRQLRNPFVADIANDDRLRTSRVE